MATKFKGMRFCEDCDNMLDPREVTSSDPSQPSSLQFECKLCSRFYPVPAADEVENCVFRTDYTMRVENLRVDPEVVKDPTLTKYDNLQCKHCGHNEAVSYTTVTQTKMMLILVCTGCTRYWQKGEGKLDTLIDARD